MHFRTRSYDPYASNISIEYISNGLVPTTVRSDDSGSDRIIQVFYQSLPPTTAADIILAIQSDYKANEWLAASLRGPPSQIVTRAFSQDYFDDLTCNCVGGECNLVLDTVDNWNGISEFTYQLRDRDGLSLPRLIPVTVKQVNDPPAPWKESPPSMKILFTAEILSPTWVFP